MVFEYIRPIPSPAAVHSEQEPALPLHVAERLVDEPELAELVAHACALAPDDAPLACPALPSSRVELPRFSGISLADAALLAAAPACVPTVEREPLPVTASLPSQPRVLLGPGAMTMTLAIAATLAFGVFVVTH